MIDSRSRKVPIIFLSGAVAYKNPHASKIKESDPKVVSGLGGFYGFSKLLAEKIFTHISEVGLKYVILIPSSIYGFGLPGDKLVQNLINKASSNEVITIMGHKNRINFIHAYDVANAALQAYKNQSWGIFNISSIEKKSILEVAETAVSLSGNGSIVILEDKKKIPPFIRFDLDSELAKKSFGFEVKVTLKEGMTLMKNNLLLPC